MPPGGGAVEGHAALRNASGRRVLRCVVVTHAPPTGEVAGPTPPRSAIVRADGWQAVTAGTLGEFPLVLPRRASTRSTAASRSGLAAAERIASSIASRF